MGGFFSFWLRVLAVALGAAALLWQPSPEWIETAYANGAYPAWEHAAFAVTHVLPWSLGDVAALIGIVAILWLIVRFARAGRGKKTPRLFGSLVLSIAAILGVYAIWFEVSWGWNYARAPIEARVDFEQSRVTARAADLTRDQAIANMNALAVPAHAESGDALDLDTLRTTWLPAVTRVGDRWEPQTGEPKPTIADPFMEATGTSGFINPLTLNVQLASDVLWFERPFALSHEWSHVAAYAREDEANYLAILTCIRSTDPRVEYSGWLELFLYLPPKTHYTRRTFDPLVWADFQAMRRRDAHHINVLLSHWTWNTYNAYLKTNHVASGIYNYNEVSRLILGVRVDSEGLPVAK
jgi:Protein of unknown function (DUF3810)